MQEVIEKIRPVVIEMLKNLGLELFDLSFKRERGNWVLRVVIDDPNGYVSIKQCEKVSEELGEYLDLNNVIEHSYVLEVSSPGLDRPMRGLEDYKRFVGKLAKFWLTDGRFVMGHIIQADETEVVVETESGKIEFRPDQVSKSKLEVEF
ncbi:MAG TPA: ribosome maturation factor RimP [Pseudothermotoga sp.]|nr:ribosome maturation factor RimP [Pseudothermotoga sp.]HOK83920.1 ribosome maturation factor RimP [Pseudothermotoga sp.]HPP70694.1 ribosome maturation factor RimP [Pseudothermotoga sp.]